MEKELIDFLKDKIDNYLRSGCFECDGDEYGDYRTEEWQWGEKLVVVNISISGYNKHDRGDYYNPPTNSGMIIADVEFVTVVDEDNVTEYRDTKELSTTYEY